MFNFIVRQAKRFAVLLPILVVAYFSIFNIFPILDRGLPILFAALVTYILAAYVLIPAIIRLIRIVVPSNHLPLYCLTPDGFASDPLNIAVIGTRKQLTDAMLAAGWYHAVPVTPRSIVRMALSTIYNWEYPNGPMSSLFLFGRKQDLAFQLPLGETGADNRHHVRFWAASFKDDDKLSVRSINWQHRTAHLRNDRLLWVGAASLDRGVTFMRHTLQFTHLVDPNTNAERDLLGKQLVDLKNVDLYKNIKLTNPYRLVNVHALKGHINSDGRMKIYKITGRTTNQAERTAPPKSK